MDVQRGGWTFWGERENRKKMVSLGGEMLEALGELMQGGRKVVPVACPGTVCCGSLWGSS